MDLAVVIVSYNVRALTADCLDTVYAALAQTPGQSQVWVVDNASADGSAALVAERFPQAQLIANAENLGFAGGVNLALERIAQGSDLPEYVFLLNPDTRVALDAIALMLAFLKANPRVGVVGAQLAYGDGRFQHGAFHFPTLWMAFFDFWPVHHRLLNSRLNGRYPLHSYRAGQPFAIDHPLGAAMLTRWRVLDQVGRLDTDYFMYCEEIDWCLRIKRAGWGIYCVPQARIVHLEGQSTRQFRERMFIALWRSRLRLFDRHYSRAYRWAVRVILRAGLRRLIRQATHAVAQSRATPDEAERRIQAYRTVMEMAS